MNTSEARFIFFLYNDIDTRRCCTKKVQPLKSAVAPCIGKIRDLGIGSELKVSVDSGLERLKVVCSWEDRQRKRVLNEFL